MPEGPRRLQVRIRSGGDSITALCLLHSVPCDVLPPGTPLDVPFGRQTNCPLAVSIVVPSLRSGTKPVIRDLPPARIDPDCLTTADAPDPRPPSPGSP